MKKKEAFSVLFKAPGQPKTLSTEKHSYAHRLPQDGQNDMFLQVAH